MSLGKNGKEYAEEYGSRKNKEERVSQCDWHDQQMMAVKNGMMFCKSDPGIHYSVPMNILQVGYLSYEDEYELPYGVPMASEALDGPNHFWGIHSVCSPPRVHCITPSTALN
jgi:hypothetical protein